jgi:Tfp pilus assembly PilM family ATPase
MALEGLDEIFQHEVKINTTIAKLSFDNNKIISPQFIVAYGLALRDDF